MRQWITDAFPRQNQEATDRRRRCASQIPPLCGRQCARATRVTPALRSAHASTSERGSERALIHERWPCSHTRHKRRAPSVAGGPTTADHPSPVKWGGSPTNRIWLFETLNIFNFNRHQKGKGTFYIDIKITSIHGGYPECMDMHGKSGRHRMDPNVQQEKNEPRLYPRNRQNSRE